MLRSRDRGWLLQLKSPHLLATSFASLLHIGFYCFHLLLLSLPNILHLRLGTGGVDAEAAGMSCNVSGVGVLQRLRLCRVSSLGGVLKNGSCPRDSSPGVGGGGTIMLSSSDKSSCLSSSGRCLPGSCLRVRPLMLMAGFSPSSNMFLLGVSALRLTLSTNFFILFDISTAASRAQSAQNLHL